MVIDLQPGFSDPASPWYTPALAEAAERIARLVTRFGERVLFTRFVPPDTVSGSWQSYYAKWDFAIEASSAWLWDLDPAFQGRLSIASHTFSKWVPEAKAHIGDNPTVVLCGVSTDCCVLMTALAAVDDGAHVRVVTDACAAKSPEIHERAIALMASRAPQLTLVTTDMELAAVTAVQARTVAAI
jgi:nicotinamidase-related amidase